MKAINRITACCLLMLLVTQTSNAADRFWVASTSSNFNNTANWSAISDGAGGASVPGASDIAIFDGGGLGNCALDVNVNVAGLTVTSGYTGTISQGISIVTIGSFGASFSGGTFAGGSANITIKGDLTIGGTAVFTSTSGILEINGNYTLTGTFNHNNGTLKFLVGSNTITGSTTLNNLEFAASPLVFISDYEISSNTILTVTGDLLTSGFNLMQLNTGTIDAKGDITINNLGFLFGGGTATININGTGNQTLTGSGTANLGHLPNINIDKPSGTLFLSNIISVGSNTTWTFTQGNIDAITNNSTVFFRVPTIIAGSHTLNNVELGFAPGIGGVTITTGTELTVPGTLTLGGPGTSIIKMEGGIINAQGDILVTNTSPLLGLLTATIVINGTGNQLFTGVGIPQRGWLPNITIFKPSGTLTLSNFISVRGDWNYITGNVDAITNNSTVVFFGGNEVDGEGIPNTMTFNNVVLRFGANVLLTGDLIVHNLLSFFFGAKMILNNNTLILENDDAGAITAPTTAGAISETTDNQSKVQWNIGNNTGNFRIPFTNAAGEDLSLTLNVSTAGTQSGIGSFTVSTFPTNFNNLPLPFIEGELIAGELRDSTNQDISLDAVDRFWKIDASNYSINPTASLAFKYRNSEIGGSNTIIEADLKAFRWTGTQWEVNPLNLANPSVNTVTAVNVSAFSSWMLAEGFTPLTNHLSMCIVFESNQPPFTDDCIPDNPAVDNFCFNSINGICAPDLACNISNPIPGCSINCTCPDCAEKIYTVFYDNNGGLAIPACSVQVTLPPGIILDGVSCPFSLVTPLIDGSTLIEWFDLCNPSPPIGACTSVNMPGSDGFIDIFTHIACCTEFCTDFEAIAELVPPFATCPSVITDLNTYCGPYDPNSKIILGPNPCEIVDRTETLNYQITFQNLGTAPATNVTIIDTLDFENLDVSSVETIETSFPATISIAPPGIVTWTFTNINLPDSASDPEGSIGFVKFRIIPDQNIVPGTVIEDRAGIIFDNLLPIITNTTKVTIEGTLIAVDAGPDDTITIGQNVTLTASVTGGTSPISFLWSTGETTASITVSPTDTTTFTVTVADANGCPDVDEVIVNVTGPEDCSNFPCGNNKVVVCHFPPGNPGNPQTICVSANSVDAHLTNHGDVCGPCGGSKWGGSSAQTNNEVISNDENLYDEPGLLDEDRYSLQSSTTIFPNPNPGQFMLLMLPDVVKTETSVYLYNVLGEVIYKNERINKPYLNFDISNHPKGIYFVKVIKGKDLFVDKIIYQ